jgi:preprotein translocase subunit SecD
MFRNQIVTIIATLFLIGVASLIYGSRALADLSAFDPAEPVFETKLILAPDTIIPGNQEVELIAARPVIAKRLDKLGLDGPYNLVIRNDQLEVTLPPGRNVPYIASLITSVGEIVFINGGRESPPVGEMVNLGTPSAEHPTYPILFTSRELQEIVLPDSANGQIFYRLTLEPTAANRLTDFIAANPGAYVCMVLDDQAINCSSMYHQSGNSLEILPELSSGGAISMTDLSIFLHSGPLSTRLKVLAD